MSHTFESIPIGELYPSPTNPRKHFDQAKLTELAASVKADGIIQPIVVRLKPKGGKRYEVVAGERRYRAGVLAGIEQVPAIVRDLSDQKVLEIQIIENLQREDVNAIEEGNGYRALLNLRVDGKPVHTADTIAEAVNKSREHVYARMKVAQASKPVQEAMMADKIRPGHAILIARLHAQGQAEALKMTLDCDYTVRQLNDWINRTLYLNLKAAPFPTDDATLLPKVGACGPCEEHSGFAPDLYPDLKGKDVCMDRECYSAKVDSLVQIRIDQAKAEANKGTAKARRVVRLTTRTPNYRESLPAGTFTYGTYSYDDNRATDTKGKACDSSAIGVLIDGPEAGKRKEVCPNHKCKVHYPASSFNAMTPAEQAKRKKQIADAKLQARTDRLLKEAILSRVKWPLTRADMVAIARGYVREMQHENAKQAATLIGLEPAKASYGGKDWRKALVLHAEKSNDAVLAQLLILLTLQPAYGDDKDAIKAAADRYKVDPAAIAKQAVQTTAQKAARA